VEEEERVSDEVGTGVGIAVEVITTRESTAEPPGNSGLWVTTEVMRTSESVGAGASDVGGTKEFEGTVKEEAGADK
jgi:hypothetical protein